MANNFFLGARSEQRLQPVHPDLAAVVRRAIKISTVDFTVLEGLRERQRQAQLVKEGKSQTMNSRHLTGHAVDLAALQDGKVSWEWELYDEIAAAMKQAAAELNVAIVWGGDWQTFKDGVHFELDRKVYP